MTSSRERYLAFRQTLGRPPRLERHIVRLRGLDLAVWTSPAVPGAVPLCCVNGGLLYGHRSLWPTLQGLAATRQLVLYDQRGRGASAAPPGARAARLEHDAGDLAALVAAIAPRLGHPRCDVLGHSWGGGIAMLAAALDAGSAAPAVRRLVLVDPVGMTGDWLPGLHPRALARLQAAAPAAHDALAALDPAALAEPDPVRHAAYARAFFPAWFADPSLAPLFAPPAVASPTGTAVAARLRREGYDWRDTLRAARASALVVHGADDLIAPSVAEATVAALHAAAPPARLALLPGVGHMPFWEAPAAFLAAVQSFLDVPTLPA